MSDSVNQQLIGHMIYFVQGFPLFFLNLTIVCAVLVHEPIRRRNTCLILAIVAANDALTGLGFIVGGATRLYFAFDQSAHEPITSLECLLRPTTYLFLPIQHTYGLLMCAVSVDRLLSLWMPLRHGGFGHGYVLVLLILTHAPLLPAYGYLVYVHWGGETASASVLCLPQDYFPPTYYSHVNAQWLLLLLLSGLIYLVVVIKIKKPTNAVAPFQQHPESVAAFLKQQRALTTSLGLSCLATVCLLVLPIIGQLVMQQLGVGVQSIQAYMLVVRAPLSCFSMIANFFIFTRRHKDIRLAVKYLFLCKELTEVAANEAR